MRYYQLAGLSSQVPYTMLGVMRVLLVDDNVEFLATAKRVLELDGLQVVAIAVNSQQAVAAAHLHSSDVTLVDINLCAESGFDVARRIREESASARIIFISTHAFDDFAELIAEIPGAGFVSKSRLSAEAIRQVFARPHASDPDGAH